eukprot:TRINITY_DN4897_c0_g1_i3.p1 TRINITY_DN4897_c0_g1~~TRINITY_DN4897_c0_g1_i3.p1  ORF type:complete len:136 (-),score=35.27 TRINITY_DN4897_c0_g1_i3:146-553(-)
MKQGASKDIEDFNGVTPWSYVARRSRIAWVIQEYDNSLGMFSAGGRCILRDGNGGSLETLDPHANAVQENMRRVIETQMWRSTTNQWRRDVFSLSAFEKYHELGLFDRFNSSVSHFRLASTIQSFAHSVTDPLIG